jgi:hypothetical protein
MKHLIDEELNIKVVTPVESGDALVKYVVKPNFRTIGKGPYKSMIPKIKALWSGRWRSQAALLPAATFVSTGPTSN